MLHPFDFGSTSEPRQAVQVNRSILGDNLLYAEESEAGYVFTNYTTTRAAFLTDGIFQYLYEQAQKDSNGTFTESEERGRVLYILEDAHTCLFRDGTLVCYFTAPAELLTSRGLTRGSGSHATFCLRCAWRIVRVVCVPYSWGPAGDHLLPK